MSASEDRVTVRCTGTQPRILEVATGISKLYPKQIVETSKIKKNENDEFFHIFLTIELAPPKEQTDVKVREVH